VGETAENQRKTREKTKVAENQVFWLDFCAKKRTMHYLSEKELFTLRSSSKFPANTVFGGFFELQKSSSETFRPSSWSSGETKSRLCSK
jgi:hypothetical protein